MPIGLPKKFTQTLGKQAVLLRKVKRYKIKIMIPMFNAIND
jgi:hypothetical protein